MTIGFDVEAQEIPLLQNCFIEASAGTGKSYTIKTWVVRLILEKELRMDQILVVTFTRAATLELKEAIREALKKALSQLQNEELFPAYLQPYANDAIKKKKAERLLKGALALMDNAKILTLHGFAAYLISQYKTSGVLSEETVASTEQLALLMKDFFRTELSTQEIALWQQEILLEFYQGDFERVVQEVGHLAVKRIPIHNEMPSQDLLEKERLHLRSLAHVEKLHEIALSFKGICNKKREVKEEVVLEFQKLAAWIEGEERELKFKELFKLLPENKMQKGEGEHLYTPLLLLLQKLNDPLRIFAFIAEKARLYLVKVLEKEYLFFYDDLLLQADLLIENKEIQEAIRAEFRFAFIDEFQDTDALQWKIFSTLFLQQGSLVVVGDPKQSIYRFRLADLYTYIHAKESFQYHLSLHTNYRSGPRLVEALNLLCGSVDDFLLLPRREESFPCPRLLPASYEGTDHSLCEIWEVESEEQLFFLIAEELSRLQNEQGISLSECAILVKDRYQMERFVEAMKPYSLPLTMMKEKLSPAHPLIFDLLDSLLDPHDLSKNVKVLLSPLFSLSLEEIEGAQLALLPDFFSWSHILQEKGILAAIEMVMKRCASSLLRQEGGTALYRDLMQFAVLGEEAALLPTEILPFYRNLSKVQEEKTRSDGIAEEAVTVTTIHMSKGLEFRVVFPIGVIAPYIQKRQLIYSSSKHSYHIGDDTEEEKAEKMRLFYVAITRAKERLYLPYIKDEKTRHSLMELFQSKSRGIEGIPVRSFIGKERNPFTFEKKKEDLFIPHFLAWPSFLRRQIHSFSSLYPHAFYEKEATTNAPVFPTGAEVGIIIHRLLEKISFRHSHSATLKQAIAPMLLGTSLEEYLQPITDLIFQTIHLPLKSGFTLADLDEKKMKKEVSFSMKTRGEGMRGVIDLFFYHKGQYYFLDWKSNHLDNYGNESLALEMQKCHYEEQACIYKEALASYIALCDKRPFSESFGGYFYLFIRGPAVFYGR